MFTWFFEIVTCTTMQDVSEYCERAMITQMYLIDSASPKQQVFICFCCYIIIVFLFIPQAGIRTNTTVCLGKIATNLPPAVCTCFCAC